jgi:hypothetical protein
MALFCEAVLARSMGLGRAPRAARPMPDRAARFRPRFLWIDLSTSRRRASAKADSARLSASLPKFRASGQAPVRPRDSPGGRAPNHAAAVDKTARPGVIAVQYRL